MEDITKTLTTILTMIPINLPHIIPGLAIITTDKVATDTIIIMALELMIAVLVWLELAVHAVYSKHASDDESSQQYYHISSIIFII